MSEILEDLRSATIDNGEERRPATWVVPPKIYEYLKRKGGQNAD